MGETEPLTFFYLSYKRKIFLSFYHKRISNFSSFKFQSEDFRIVTVNKKRELISDNKPINLIYNLLNIEIFLSHFRYALHQSLKKEKKNEKLKCQNVPRVLYLFFLCRTSKFYKEFSIQLYNRVGIHKTS